MIIHHWPLAGLQQTTVKGMFTGLVLFCIRHRHCDVSVYCLLVNISNNFERKAAHDDCFITSVLLWVFLLGFCMENTQKPRANHKRFCIVNSVSLICFTNLHCLQEISESTYIRIIYITTNSSLVIPMNILKGQYRKISLDKTGTFSRHALKLSFWNIMCWWSQDK